MSSTLCKSIWLFVIWLNWFAQALPTEFNTTACALAQAELLTNNTTQRRKHCAGFNITDYSLAQAALLTTSTTQKPKSISTRNRSNDAIEEECFSSILSWSVEEQSYEIAKRWRTNSYPTTTEMEYSLIDGTGVTRVGCDNITRVSNFTSTGYHVEKWKWSGVITSYTSIPEAPKFDQIKPKPTCSIGVAVCAKELYKLDEKRLDGFEDPREKWRSGPGGERLQPCDHSFDDREPHCEIDFDNVNLWYWREDIVSRDLCANNLFGTHQVKWTNSTSLATPKVVTVTNVVFKPWDPAGWKYVYALPKEFAPSTWTGTWTFTSPSMYIAYQTLQALVGPSYDLYGSRHEKQTVGNVYSSGFLPIHPSQLSSVVDKCTNIATSLGASALLGHLLGFGQCADEASERRPFNIADLYAGVPAAAWFGGGLGFGPYIRENDYTPTLAIPKEVFYDFDPSWRDAKCLPLERILDPSRAFSPVEDLMTPVSLPSFATPVAILGDEQIGSEGRKAMAGSPPAAPTPWQTASAAAQAQSFAEDPIFDSSGNIMEEAKDTESHGTGYAMQGSLQGASSVRGAGNGDKENIPNGNRESFNGVPDKNFILNNVDGASSNAPKPVDTPIVSVLTTQGDGRIFTILIPVAPSSKGQVLVGHSGGNLQSGEVADANPSAPLIGINDKPNGVLEPVALTGSSPSSPETDLSSKGSGLSETVSGEVPATTKGKKKSGAVREGTSKHLYSVTLGVMFMLFVR